VNPTDPDEATAVLTDNTGGPIDESLVVNGRVDVRKTHPTLYRQSMLFGIGNVVLGVNFHVFTPTFLVYGLPNWVWGTAFIALGIGEVFFLNVYRRLDMARLVMALCVAYTSVFALGTMQPALEGKGSLQLPILYGLLVVWKLLLLLEPFINPWTARRGG
jgi:hypothetical protein